MPQHIKITTDFDITNTGIVRPYKDNTVLPVKLNKHLIETKEQWLLMRRQQSNWETLIQIISLRSQPLNLRTSEKNKEWTLEFDIDVAGAFLMNNDQIGILKEDCNNVPLLVGLTETAGLDSFLVLKGENSNIRFETFEL